MQAFKYRIVTEWSDVDQVFVARVPALGLGCAAHGNTAERAAKEVQIAAALILEVMAEQGDPIPPPDASLDYSGKLGLRLPKSMHEQVAQLAAADDVSINTKLLTLIAHGLGQSVAESRPRGRPRTRVAPKTNRATPKSPSHPPTGDKPRKYNSFIDELSGEKRK